MKNLIKVLLFPMVIYFAFYYFCYEIFWWIFIMERSPRTKPQKYDSTCLGGISEAGRDILMACGFGKS